MNVFTNKNLPDLALPKIHPYERLTPDCILNALEQQGFAPDGTLMPLNSYENRVYAFRDHERNRFVVKFYRPERWSAAQIQEEHDFLFFLSEREIPVIAPLRNEQGQSLYRHEEFLFCVFPQRGGRAFELGNEEQLGVIGRIVGRLHLAAQAYPFQYRERLTVADYADKARLHTLSSPQLPRHVAQAYGDLTEQLLATCQSRLTQYSDMEYISAHGDLHAGNILWTGEGVLLVDFDDSRSAFAVQDLWMLINDNFERDIVIAEYENYLEFDWRQWPMVEAFRTMRMIQYTGWLASRWQDPSFPHHFPWFGKDQYFEEQLHLLRQQAELLAQ